MVQCLSFVVAAQESNFQKVTAAHSETLASLLGIFCAPVFPQLTLQLCAFSTGQRRKMKQKDRESSEERV